MGKQSGRGGLASGYGVPKGLAKPVVKKNKLPNDRKKVCDQLAARLCGAVDPFCTMACGCKMMDKTSSRVFTYSSKFDAGLGTDANGNAARFFTPGINDVTAGYSSITAGVVTWAAATNLPEATSLVATAAKYRIVSAGIRVYSTAAPTNASGTVKVCTIKSDTSVAAPTGFNVDSFLYEEVDVGSLYQFDRSYVFRDCGTEKALFEDTSSTDGHAGWNSFVVCVTGGAASTTVLKVEVTIHYELQPEPITIYSRLADPPAPHIPELESIVSNSVNDLQLSYPSEKATSSIMDLVKGEVYALASKVNWEEFLGMAMMLL